MSTTPASDLAAVLPSHRTIPVAGEQFTIRQIKVGQITAVLIAAQPLADMFAELKLLKTIDKPVDMKDMLAKAPAFMITHTAEVLNLLSVLACKPIEWVNDLEIDEAGNLFIELLEVNITFFIQRILPMVQSAMQSLAAKVPKAVAGQIASTPSSKPVTTTNK